jgi:tetratricopeptide (TPR) repeat protein
MASTTAAAPPEVLAKPAARILSEALGERVLAVSDFRGDLAITVERRAWAEAAQLPVLPANTPFTQAMTHFARAVGAARSGNPGAVPVELAAMTALRDKMIAAKDAYWTEQIEIQRRVADAWMQFAQGKRDAAIAELASAADAEDATDKSPISPGPLAPARELLGYMLLEAGRAQDALGAFEAVMKKEPNRFLAFYGAGQAAEALKDAARTKQYYGQLVAMCQGAPDDRPELVHARKMAK